MAQPVPYDPLAHIYDTYWGFFIKRCLPVLDRLLLEKLEPGAKILDLCCGTGSLIVVLQKRGFQASGLDSSEAMLHAAQLKAPESRLLLADVRSFNITAEFDAVISTFDSLNHVLHPDELQIVFENVCRALRPGGWFLFDLNLQEGFLDRWQGQSADVREHTALFAQMCFDQATGRGQADLTLFEADAHGWSRHDVTLIERCYADSEVLALLASAGFAQVGLEVQAPASMVSGRGFFYGRRPS